MSYFHIFRILLVKLFRKLMIYGSRNILKYSKVWYAKLTKSLTHRFIIVDIIFNKCLFLKIKKLRESYFRSKLRHVVNNFSDTRRNILHESFEQFLQLPTANRFVKNLSGGQQRRVSFAAALLADPELMILDEPTVGVDPVLRQNIWDHLVDLTKNSNKTIIITTHYIEETRQAGIIGLMRSGRLLAEESPTRLMEMHNVDTLEEVFLKLSRRQNMGLRRRSSILSSVTGVPPEGVRFYICLLTPSFNLFINSL